MSAEATDELAQVNDLRRQTRPSGFNEWDYGVMVLRTASVLAMRREGTSNGSAARVGSVAAALAPAAWSVIQASMNRPSSAAREAIEEVGVCLSTEAGADDHDLTADVVAVVREVEARRSANVQLSDGARVQVVAVRHAAPFIPDLYTGLCLLNKTLLDTAVEALPPLVTPILETIEERVVLHFGADVDVAGWRSGLNRLWRQRLHEIFSDRMEERLGPLSNVLLLTTGLSQRAPLDYVPRPLINDFGQYLEVALRRRRSERLALAGGDPARVEEAYHQTRAWLVKNLGRGGYGKAMAGAATDEALALHPACVLAQAICLGAAGASPARGSSAGGKSCVYCGNSAESIETPEMAEGSGVKKFSKRWIATGGRSFASLCARCSLASFLQLRLLGCYSAGGNVGPRRFFTVFHEGVYSNSRLGFLGRWADAYYTLLREGNLIRQLGTTLKQKPTAGAEEADEDQVDTPEPAANDVKQNLKRLGKALEEIQSNAGELRGYLEVLRARIPALDTSTGISIDEVGYLAERLEALLRVDPPVLDTDIGVQVRDLVERLLDWDAQIAGGVADPIVDAFRRKPGDQETGITTHDLGGTATSRLILLGLPVLPQAKKGSEWIDLSRHFAVSRAAVTLTLGWLWRRYPGTYWWGMPIARDDGLIHTPFGVAGTREIRQFDVAWTLASRIVPSRRAEYPQLLALAEKLVDDPVTSMARILRRQGDARTSVRRLSVDQLSEFAKEVTTVGHNGTDAG